MWWLLKELFCWLPAECNAECSTYRILILFCLFVFFGFVIFIYLFIYFFLWGLLKDLCLVFWSLNLCVIFFALEDCFLGLLATGLKAKNDSVKEREADNISPSAFNVWLNLTTCLPAFQSCMVSYWESLIFPIFFLFQGDGLKLILIKYLASVLSTWLAKPTCQWMQLEMCPTRQTSVSLWTQPDLQILLFFSTSKLN